VSIPSTSQAAEYSIQTGGATFMVPIRESHLNQIFWKKKSYESATYARLGTIYIE